MRLSEEFKEYEKLWENTSAKKVDLRESKDLAKLKSELAELRKREAEILKELDSITTLDDELPTEVFIWDAYIESKDKGTFMSADLYEGKWDGRVFETEEEAVDACQYHLEELENENELDGASPDDYTIDTFVVPIEEVNEDSLVRSGLKSGSEIDLGTIFHF